MCFKSRMRSHNHGYLSPHGMCNSAVWTTLLVLITDSPYIEFLFRFYAWRIHQCTHLDSRRISANTVCCNHDLCALDGFGTVSKHSMGQPYIPGFIVMLHFARVLR